jgi:ATP-binding cassette, subfamily F, member 3
MSILTAHDLGIYYGAQDVFHGVSFAIARGDKVGLVGPNGEGKTTLLRIILGDLQPTSGIVQRSRTLEMAYLPQIPNLHSERTLFGEMLSVFEQLRTQERRLMSLTHELSQRPTDEDLLATYARAEERFERAGGYTYESRIRRVLGGIGFSEEAFCWPIDILSGGQITRALLAKLLLQEPDLLVLDEPTNYLDLEALEWLESYLQAWPKSLIIVSHDRYFLDQVVNRIWELEGGTVTTYRGNYSAYLTERAHRRERQRREYEEQQELIARTEHFVQRYKAGQRSKQARGREKQLERLERIQPPRERRALSMRMRASLRSGDEVLTSEGIVVGYATTPDTETDGVRPMRLFDTGELRIERGDRIALLGANGCGKTTFLRTLMDDMEPLQGRVRRGASLRIGYLAQTHDWFDPSFTVLEQLMAQSKLKRDQALHHLARFLFTGDAVDKHVGALSGGERSRLGLATLTLRGANWLILDEPTTHLDVVSRETLEQVLAGYNGTLLFVSHDRYLVDAVATQVWMVRQGHLDQFEGNYSEYAQARAQETSRIDQTKPTSTADHSTAPTPAGRSVRETARRTEELEEQIHLLEERLDDLQEEMARASAAQNVTRLRELSESFGGIESELAELLSEWERQASAMLQGD